MHREPYLEAQARKVMMKHISMETAMEHLDEATFDEF